jgi:mRNA interferase HicA
MKRGDLLRHLKAQGCELEREGANHTIYRNPATGTSSPVPRHEELGPGLVWKICRELEIERPAGR